MELAIIVWLASAALSYFIASQQAPSQAAMAAILGIAFGPLGVVITCFLKD